MLGPIKKLVKSPNFHLGRDSPSERNLEEEKILEEKIKIENLAKGAHKNLFQVRTVFPLDFFQDDLIIDPLKVSHIHRVFFFTEVETAILIENIRHVEVSSGPFFSTLIIIDNVYNPNTITVSPLFKNQAKEAQALLQGLVVSKREHIDTTKIGTSTSIPKIEDLGTPNL